MDCIVDRVCQLVNIDGRQGVPHGGWTTGSTVGGILHLNVKQKKESDQDICIIVRHPLVSTVS